MPPVTLFHHSHEPPVIVLPLVPLVNVKFADEFVPLIVAIEFGSAANIPNVPDPSKFKAVSALLNSPKTIKLVVSTGNVCCGCSSSENIDKNISIRISSGGPNIINC